VLMADMQNQRIRQLWPAVNYTVTSTPAGLQVTVDSQQLVTRCVSLQFSIIALCNY